MPGRRMIDYPAEVGRMDDNLLARMGRIRGRQPG